jgi:hypothetical protein
LYDDDDNYDNARWIGAGGDGAGFDYQSADY